MKVKIVLLLFYVKSIFSNEIKDDPTVITIPSGQIRGHVLKSSNNNDYYAFQEIPYAAPPVGELRFKVPVAPKNWEGILNTTENTKMCYQQNLTPLPVETEDCLYLNVYTPKLSQNNASVPLLPVLFYINGGGFVNLTGNFEMMGPHFLIDYEIVIVTMNYRLGPFGFLATEDGVIPGNLGLRDQTLSLKWTNENIELFGGDPSQITIGGVSAGAASVGHLLISKQTQGLFRGAILESGTAVCTWANQPNYNSLGYQVGAAIDPEFTSENATTELLKLLQNVTAAEIINVITLFSFVDIPWLPVIENPNLEDSFVVGPMHENIKNGDFNQVPVLLGFNSEEILRFIEFSGNELFNQLAKLYDNSPSQMLNNFNITIEYKDLIALELRKIYSDDTFEDDFAALLRFLSDEFFTSPVIRHAELQSNYTDVFLYEFAYKGELGQSMNDTIEGTATVGHGEEYNYFWCTSFDNNCTLTIYPESDILTQKRLLKLWTNFVKYLDPTPVEDELLENVIWPSVTSTSLSFLNISENLEVKAHPKHYEEWKTIVDPFVIPPIITY